MKITFPVLVLYFLAALLASVACWFMLVVHDFVIAEPFWQNLLNGLLHTFGNHQLRWVAIKALAVGFFSTSLVLYFVGDWSSNNERIVRGTRLMNGEQLARQTRIKSPKNTYPVQVEIAGVPIPLGCEPSHFLEVGSTNTGKSTAIDQLLSSSRARGDRQIVVDPNGHALARFAKNGDTVLNPFDQRSPGWSLFNEIRKPFDYDRIAESVVPDSTDTESKQWRGYARQMLAETMRAMAQEGELSTERLLYWLTQASTKDLSSFLAGSAAGGLFEPGAEKALAGTRFILNYHVGPFQYLRPGKFSLRTWLENGQGNLYFTWREDMLSSLKPLVSCWVEILTASILTLPTDNPRPLWLVLDELASLERLTSLEAGLTKGRKHGLRVVAGLQSVAQLDAVYGHDNAKTLRSCFRNLLALGCSNADPDTANAISEGLGQIEVERTQTTYSRGHSGNSTSKSLHRSTESIVLPSQLMSLPPLHGYLKLAGDYPVTKIQLIPGDYPVRFKPFVER